jgi:hypothetical protein
VLEELLGAGGAEYDVWPKEHYGRAETMSWLMWQMGSAPYLCGGFGHFYV